MRLNGSVASPLTLAPGRISATGIVFIAVAAATPVSLIATVVPGLYTHGVPGVPLIFLFAGVLLAVFSAGYSAMARRAPHAAPLSSFIALGLGRPFGVAAGWLALVAYQVLQLALYSLAGAAASPLLYRAFGVRAQWWMVAAVCWLIVGVFGIIRVEFAGGLLALLVLAEIAVLAGFDAANLLAPAGRTLTWDTLDPRPLLHADRPTVGFLLVLAVLAFAGFESTPAYAEEARGPRRALPGATYAAVALITLLATAGSWATSVAVGPGRMADLAANRGPELMFDLAGPRLAPWAVTLGRVLLLTGLLAAMISLQHTISRYVFAFGRERILPSWLSRTARRTSAPRAASLFTSVVVALLLAVAVLFGVDPPAHLLAVSGALVLLLLLVGASLAALLQLNRAPDGENVWLRFVAPLAGTVALASLAYLACVKLPVLLGDQRWIVLASMSGLVVFGVLQAAVIRLARPVTYAGIGLGGAAVVVPTPITIPQPRTPGAHRPERIVR